MDNIDTVLAIITGIGLSAACGFRIFVPLLLLSLVSNYGLVNLSPEFEWIGSNYALMAFATATVFEVIAYYIPWLDNLMDTIASPISVIAGIIASASVITDIPPVMKWLVAIIAGGGIAGIMQGATTALRAKSSLFTGGIGNPVLSTSELVMSAMVSAFAIVLPLIGFIFVLALGGVLFIKVGKSIFRRRKSN